MPKNIRTGGVKPIRTIQESQEVQDVAEQIPQIVGIISIEDKPALVKMLKRSGSLVTEVSTHRELLDATLKAIKDSHRFRKDLSAYIKGKASVENFGNFVDDDSRWNYADPTTTTKKKTFFGNVLSTVFTKENTSALLDAGITAFSTSLQNKANKLGNQQAIDFERAKADTAIAQAQLEALKGSGGATKDSGTKNKWILPVAIGGGVILLGVVIFLAVKKK